MTPTLLVSTRPSGTSVTTVYTVAASKAVKLSTFSLCNSTASASAVDIHVVPSGGSATTSNLVVYSYNLLAYDTLSLTDVFDGLMLGEGDFVAVKTTVANSVVFTATGVVIA